jgi:hypothetical protein
MPFDSSNEIRHQHSMMSDLVQQADEALEACERDTCVDLIQQIYELLDLATAARLVVPAGMHINSASRVLSAVAEGREQHH